ncbi:MAG: DUF3667 domain-containing protein [Proteobacteria bacterium]|nr:DUF3667 domain-containing protein [Pseudomonadota bacterium]
MADGAGYAPAAFGPVAAATAAPQHCTNCATPLAGRYCHACGQDTVPAETALRSWRDYVARLGRTLRALVFQPGELTAQQLYGGRVRYVAPFTLYLNLVAVFFLLSGLADFHVWSVVDRVDWLQDLIEKRAQARDLSEALFLERVDRRFQAVYTLSLSVISVLGYAGVARFVFRNRWHDWRGPVTFALHFMAFVFVVFMPGTMVLVRLSALQVISDATASALSILLALILGAYLTLAVRRLFGDPWPWALAKGVGILVAGFPINTVMYDVAVLATLWIA